MFILCLLLGWQNVDIYKAPEVPGVEWRVTETENFSIVWLDKKQGEWAANNLEAIKAWCLLRWGFNDFKFSKECRVFCVPNKDLLKKLFKLDKSQVEVRRKDGQLEISGIWISMDEKHTKTIPILLMEVAVNEYNQVHQTKIGWWFIRGSSLLSGTLPDIRNEIVGLSPALTADQPIFVSKSMFDMTEDEYYKLSVEQRKLYDRQAICLCLMFRKEFGEAKLQGFLRLAGRNNVDAALQSLLKFSGTGEFDKSYVRYMRDLTKEAGQKTPDDYLLIKAVK